MFELGVELGVLELQLVGRDVPCEGALGAVIVLPAGMFAIQQPVERHFEHLAQALGLGAAFAVLDLDQLVLDGFRATFVVEVVEAAAVAGAGIGHGDLGNALAEQKQVQRPAHHQRLLFPFAHVLRVVLHALALLGSAKICN